MSQKTRKKPGIVPAYHGGGEKAMAAPWLYALHDIVKRRDRTLRLLPLVWPARIGVPSDAVLINWMREIEEGRVTADPKRKEWIKASLELDEQQSIREAVLETSKTLTHYARMLREKKEAPPGGVVALKYLADAAGFLAGKRSEVAQVGGKQRPIAIGSLNITAGEPRRKRVSLPPPSIRLGREIAAELGDDDSA